MKSKNCVPKAFLTTWSCFVPQSSKLQSSYMILYASETSFMISWYQPLVYVPFFMCYNSIREKKGRLVRKGFIHITLTKLKEYGKYTINYLWILCCLLHSFSLFWRSQSYMSRPFFINQVSLLQKSFFFLTRKQHGGPCCCILLI
jgi:hypothetical protein